MKDEDYASGEGDRQRRVNETRERSTSGNYEGVDEKQKEADNALLQKWREDVDKGLASDDTTEFMEQPPCENKDCLGICGGTAVRNPKNQCCKPEDEDCNGDCFGKSTLNANGQCCNRDEDPYCCEEVDPCGNCPRPGQIRNTKKNFVGCWCTPGTDELCCSDCCGDDEKSGCRLGTECPRPNTVLLGGCYIPCEDAGYCPDCSTKSSCLNPDFGCKLRDDYIQHGNCWYSPEQMCADGFTQYCPESD